MESLNRTIIDCELESLEVRVRGQGIGTNGSAMILSVVDEGTYARKGDVLCRLDSSDYEELVRQQQMNVERSKADFRQAELNLEVAQASVTEFRDGNMLQDLKQMEGQVALAKSELERLKDRLDWSERMLAKGYVSAGQVETDRLALLRASFVLAQGKMAQENYRRFSAPRTIRIFESEVGMAQAMQDYQSQRLQRNMERLENLQDQVAHCTIRAPHDGLVVYANAQNPNIRIEAGAMVRQKQHLFYLPDLAHMEVDTLLHETIVEQVKKGMRARITVEGLPGRVLEGHVVSVGQMAMRDWRNDVPYYHGTIQLDTIPPGLRPGMSAEVEVMTERRNDVLTIPPEALAVEDGRDVCYVASEDGLERREVKLGQATTDQLEVMEGLNEGEAVVLEPDKNDHLAEAADGDSEDAEESRVLRHCSEQSGSHILGLKPGGVGGRRKEAVFSVASVPSAAGRPFPDGNETRRVEVFPDRNVVLAAGDRRVARGGGGLCADATGDARSRRLAAPPTAREPRHGRRLPGTGRPPGPRPRRGKPGGTRRIALDDRRLAGLGLRPCRRGRRPVADDGLGHPARRADDGPDYPGRASGRLALPDRGPGLVVDERHGLGPRPVLGGHGAVKLAPAARLRKPSPRGERGPGTSGRFTLADDLGGSIYPNSPTLPDPPPQGRRALFLPPPLRWWVGVRGGSFLPSTSGNWTSLKPLYIMDIP